MIRIDFIGDFEISDNYPNTSNLISALEKDARFSVRVSSSSTTSERQHYQDSRSLTGKITTVWKMIKAARHSVREIKRRNTDDCDVIYVPYPAVMVLFLLALNTKKNQYAPLLIMDCFISIYDTVVIDRKMLSAVNPLAVMLKYLEKRAIARADVVLADTQANVDYLQQLYGGENLKFSVLNLCINESLFRPAEATEEGSGREEAEQIDVLFVGSFVPLQGVPLIAEAAAILSEHDQINIKMIGDGQSADAVNSLINDRVGNVEWLRGWHSIEVIAEAFAQADICLGVFGDSAKRGRVLPYKVYMAMASGRAVITAAIGDGDGDGVAPAIDIPLYMLSEVSAAKLAEAVLDLASSAAQRRELGIQASVYYQRFLSNEKAVSDLHFLLREKLLRGRLTQSS